MAGHFRTEIGWGKLGYLTDVCKKLSMSAGVCAGANLRAIKAYLNGDIQVKYNGTPLQLQFILSRLAAHS